MISRKEFNSYIVKQTNRYQKKYGFEIGSGEHASWNNEADAFKHAYLSAWLVIRHNNLFSNILGAGHEEETPNAPIFETNMDNWNNSVGREIGRDIKSKINGKNYSQEKNEDMIAEKVMQKMKSGELITNPFTDKRKFIPHDFIDKVLNHRNRVFHKGEVTMNDLDNPVLKDVFLDQALERKKMPTKKELDRKVASGELIYVEKYERSDGTFVSGYYRSYPKS